jgi:dihydropyrimidinase
VLNAKCFKEMKTILIKNADIVNSDNNFQSDILIGDGKILDIRRDIEKVDSQTEIIDAEPFLVFPGGIDPHVHMELPVNGLVSSDDFESGSIAALFGGTTTLIDFVTPERNQSLIESLKDRKKLAEKSLCDFALHMSITYFNEKIPLEMEQCVKEEGITSFKTYMAYKKTIGIGDYELISAMEVVKKLNAIITIHCENGEIINYLQEKFLKEGKSEPKYHVCSRPDVSESEAVNRAITIAKIIGTPVYLVHISAGDSIKHIRDAREFGQVVFAETCPHYLFLDKSIYEKDFLESANYVMSPPLRTKEDQNILWESLNGNILDTIGTDHCPFNREDRKRGINNFTKIPNGVPGIEDRLNLLYTYGVLGNRISLNKFIDLTSTKAAKIFGLFPRKGVIRIGSDADIILWNKVSESQISVNTHHHKCDSSIYENISIKGRPEKVILGGKVVIDSGVYINHEKGKYLFRKNCGYKID